MLLALCPWVTMCHPTVDTLCPKQWSRDKPYEIATLASLSKPFSDDETRFVGQQLKASAVLFDLPEQ